VLRKLMKVVSTQIDYTWLGKIENELRSSVYSIKEIHYLDNVVIDTYVEEGEVAAFTEWMVELTNGQGEMSEGEVLYMEELV